MGVSQEPGRPSRLHGERRGTAERGNGARWDGREGVGVPHSTWEAGELAPGDPVEGRGYRGTELLEGKMAGTSSPTTVSTGLQQIAEWVREGLVAPQRIRILRSRMREICTSGSVGGLGR
jgi:hypothetical protein